MEELSYMKFSTKWASSLCKTHNLGEDKQAELAYVIELLTITVVNAFLVLALGWLLGVFWGTLTCLLTIAAFRHNAGGGHSESPWRCGIITIVVFPLLALFAGYISIWGDIYTDLLALISIVIGFTFILRYAPVENEKSPIKSPLRRKRLKNIAILVMVIVTIIVVGLRFNQWEKAAEIRLCIVLSILWFSLNLTPFGKRVWLWVDGLKI